MAAPTLDQVQEMEGSLQEGPAVMARAPVALLSAWAQRHSAQILVAACLLALALAVLEEAQVSQLQQQLAATRRSLATAQAQERTARTELQAAVQLATAASGEVSSLRQASWQTAAQAGTQLSVGQAARGMALDGEGRFLYVAVATGVAIVDVSARPPSRVGLVIAGEALTVALDQGTQRLFVLTTSGLRTFSLAGGRQVPVGGLIALPQDTAGWVWPLAVDPRSHRVFAGGNRSLVVMDGAANPPRVLATLALGAQPGAIALNPLTHHLFISEPGADRVAILDAGSPTPRLLDSVGVGPGPMGVAVDPGTGTVYVAGCACTAPAIESDGTVSFIRDSPGGATWPRLQVGGNPMSVAVDELSHRVFLTNAGQGLTVLDGAHSPPTLLGSGLRLHGDSLGIAADPLSHRVFVSNRDLGTLLVIDPAA
jgi:DNA-binding beta-propeller fold protein YncE